jgi:plastocyanin
MLRWLALWDRSTRQDRGVVSMMRRRMLCGLVVFVLAASACGGDSSDEAGSPNDAGAVLPIQVDSGDPAQAVTLYSYFPQNVVARPGDTLHFTVSSVGEPHAIAFGTLVDKALAAVKSANFRSLEDIFFKEPPEMSVMPSIFGPPPTQKPENQSAGQPCFLDQGKPPMPDACPKREQPPFNGTQAYYNSGIVENGEHWDVKLADDIRPGTYGYMNVIYRGLMAGSVTVVERGASRPGPEEVAANGKRELRLALDGIAGDLTAAKRATPQKGLAGVVSPASLTAVGMQFEPSEAKIPVGGSMTWDLYLCHTITFNPPAGAYGDLKKMPDGSVRLNPIPYAPAKTIDPPFLVGTIDAGKWDGTGYFNSGALCALKPGTLSYTLTFTKSGTYQLVCLFHPGMVGRVTVA